MHGVDEAYLAIVIGQDQRMRAGAFAEEAHTTKQAASGDAGACEDDFLPGREIFRVVNALGILDAHLRDALVVFGFGNHQARENLAIQATQSRGGQNAFRSAPDAHNCVHAGAYHGGTYAG